MVKINLRSALKLKNVKKIWKISKVMNAVITKIESLKLSQTFKDKIEWNKIK
jgi:hypothetical protein